MARIVTHTLLFLLLVSGCAPQNRETVPTPKSSEPASAPVLPVRVEPPTNRTPPATTPPKPTLTKEEIEMFQARLKAVGFYAGPVDGIVGPKTESGLARLQAACSNLKDLLEPSSASTQTGRLVPIGNNSPSSEATRLIQVRLKDSGFDPGPIDGILGAKTRAAFLRFEAGCTMLKNLPPDLQKELQAVNRQTPLVSEDKRYPVAVGIGKTSSRNKVSGSEKIRQGQLRLRNAGFDPGPIDGILGPQTKAAMQRYQKSLKLKDSR